jgi:subtilase family serine protease
MFCEILERRVLCSASPQGLTPAQVQNAYAFNHVTFTSHGKTIRGDGSGQTIAIVDPYDLPQLTSTIHIFDKAFGLPNTDSAGRELVTKATPFGVPSVDAGWSLESALDVEWAHAMAPRARVVLVEAMSPSYSDLIRAVDYARKLKGVSVVSMSWGGPEFRGQANVDFHFTTPTGHIGGGGRKGGVTFVAASGDSGAGTIWPAASANVLSVGGTTLNIDARGNYISETAWGGSGGGVAQFSKDRTPDVAYAADPRNGFSVYDPVSITGRQGWFVVGGTSVGTPQWAALIAIADQGRALRGKASLDSRSAIHAILSLPESDFHDITTGSNGFSAHAGYDLVTGKGTPIANRVVQGLLTA